MVNPPHPADPPDEPEVPDEFAEPVVVPIEDSLDLHLFHPKEIGDVVPAYLEAAREKGFREVRLIHGKGRGIQRERVRKLVKKSADAEALAEAPADRGGWGATIVRLKPREE